MQEGADGGDLRLGIVGNQGVIPYDILTDGLPEQAWMQRGCNNIRQGLWAFKNESVGEVQCCLTSPRVHVCTRDGCLSGDRDVTKLTWHEAQAKCKSKGWRLCRPGELNKDRSQHSGSAGCCNQDACGYNMELVWTNSIGGLQSSEDYGRIDSDNAMESISEVTIEFEGVQKIREVLVQGGVPDLQFLGLACLSENWLPAFTLMTLSVHFWFWMGKNPLLGSRQGLIGGYIIWILLYAIRLIILSTDPAVPGPFSRSYICRASGSWYVRSFTSMSVYIIMTLLDVTGMIFVFFVRPQYFILTCYILLIKTNALQRVLVEPRDWTIAVIWLVAAVLMPMMWGFLNKKNKTSANHVQLEDVNMYESRWSTHLQLDGDSVQSDLAFIRTECHKVSTSIFQSRSRVVWSSTFPFWRRFLFLIRADGLGIYSRTGKVRQTSEDIDYLFESVRLGFLEQCYVNRC